ncbi:peroxisomal membrane protein PEX16-like [Mercenaria mercenaria]|uniref:peroxisomal membrane protein PEX16-like n=1 Tax=Mercenaria mercenaria TaxID=6596 RepID=UPI00234F476E|nr:peroxisomal membrane protein PEX16-like [Mercenaria mercenaria]
MAAAATQGRLDRLIQELRDQYSKAVRNNPDTVAQIESAVRILSFLVAGRFENGEILSELIYSASNLIVFINDNVFKSASKYVSKVVDITKERIKKLLTVLEYTEVFLEMAAKKKWGTKGAWVVITVIQITKTVLRFYLLVKLDGGIGSTPSIQPVDREILKTSQEEEHDNLEDAWDEEAAYSAQEKTFTLESSGRQVRTLQASGQNGMRTWGVPESGTQSPQNNILNRKRKLLNQSASKLTKQRKWAEGLHIARPLAHLISMYISGLDSWKPWLLACGMDITSMCLMGESKDLNPKEKAELKRRSLMLLYYLMRSPFYDKYTKMRFMAVFRFIAQYVPLSGFIIRPLLEYLPTWQRMYFYVWTS